MTSCRQPEEKKKKKDRDRDFEVEPELEDFHPSVKVDMEQQGDRPVRACRTQQGRNVLPSTSFYLPEEQCTSLDFVGYVFCNICEDVK